MSFYQSPKSISAYDAKFEAQKIAFAPVSFQVARCLSQFGLLAQIDKAGEAGISLTELTNNNDLSEYAIHVLLDMGLSMGIFWCKDELYRLDKTGYFLLHDDMASKNLNFIHDVCYQGLFELEASLKQGNAAGLKHLGDWDTFTQD